MENLLEKSKILGWLMAKEMISEKYLQSTAEKLKELYLQQLEASKEIQRLIKAEKEGTNLCF